MAGPNSGGTLGIVPTQGSAAAARISRARASAGKGFRRPAHATTSAPALSLPPAPSLPVSSPAVVPASTPPVVHSSPAVPSSRAAQEFAARVIVESDLKSIYAARRIGEIREDLQDFYERVAIRDGRDIAPYEDRFREIFDKRRELCGDYLNVKRQEREIRRVELRPGEIPEEEGGVPAFARQMQREIGYHREGLRGWVGRDHGYGDEPVGTRGVDNIGSIIGGTDVEMRSIRKRDEPIIHTKPASLKYRNNVFDAKDFVIEDMRCNGLELEKFLSEARKPTQEEYATVRKISMSSHRVSNLAESAASTVNGFVGSIGRGIIHKTDHTEDKRYHKFIDKRNELIASLLWSLDPEDRTEYLRVLDRVKGAMGSSDLMNPATFAQMQNLISEEIKKEKGVNQKELDSFNEKLREINERMLADMEEIVEKEDDMFKWRVLQVFLILSPLGAFSIAGEIFNYIDPLAELFGPLLDSSLTFGESLAEIGTSDKLGFVGDIADTMGFDEMVRFVFDEVPVVSDVLNAFKEIVLDNAVSQELFDIASPLLGSPLLPIAIAAGYSFSQAGAEMDHYWGNPDDKKPGANKIIERHNKDLEKLFEEFSEDTDQSKEHRIREFCARRFQTFTRMYFDTEFIKSAVEADVEDLEIFDAKFKDSEGHKVTISDLRGKYHDKEKFKTALEEIISDERNRDAFADSIGNFMVLKAVAGDKDKYQKLKAVPAEFGRLRAEQSKKMEMQFIIKAAEELGIVPGTEYVSDPECYASEDPIIPPVYDSSFKYMIHDLDNKDHLNAKGVIRLEEMIEELRGKLQARDSDHVLSLAKSTRDTPNSSFSPESTSKLHGGERLFGAVPEFGSGSTPPSLVR